ncbi:hypothetical protein GQ44DRAFT_687709 [Phaeosphaeriaceae sp. PMI808]|nr:hypothetical protein GQ44DRAFT_687709 [Phaeosphaeriaceae sp. PMI808]
MAPQLHIPPCVNSPFHPLHPPPRDKPLRIRIQGPLETIQKLLPNTSWHPIRNFPQLGGQELARLTYEKLYGAKWLDRDAAVRDDPPFLDGFIALTNVTVSSQIDYYGVTFDHLVPADDPNPEVLAINIIEVDSDGGVYADGGKYANDVLMFSIRPNEYTGRKVLAVPRCCQHKKGTQDRIRINSEVAERMAKLQDVCKRGSPRNATQRQQRNGP